MKVHNFIVRPQYTYAFKFTFKIGLHVDDVNLLHFIHKSLGFGGVWIGKSVAVFKVESLKDIRKIIFSQTVLCNTTKHLNFLDFKKAYELYTSNYNDKMESKQAIDNVILYIITRSREKPEQPLSNTRITPYWFMGFVEVFIQKE